MFGYSSTHEQDIDSLVKLHQRKYVEAKKCITDKLDEGRQKNKMGLCLLAISLLSDSASLMGLCFASRFPQRDRK
jgi:hypothetical protein